MTEIAECLKTGNIWTNDEYLVNIIQAAHEELYLYLLENGTRVRDDTQFFIKCPFDDCDDRYHNDNGKMYIKFDEDSGLIFYHCKRCPAKSSGGIADIRLFNAFGIDIEDLDKALRLRKRKLSLNYRSSLGHLNNKQEFAHKSSDMFIRDPRMLEMCSKYEKRVDYFNSRISKDISQKEVRDRYKIVYDIVDFLNINRIPYNSNQIPYNPHDYIGVLSYNNSSVILRDTSNKNHNRYYNMTLLHGKSTGILNSVVYIPNNTVNIYDAACAIHISEGMFDIINILDSIMETSGERSGIFLSVSNKAYHKGISIAHSVYGAYHLPINIYPDGNCLDDEFISEDDNKTRYEEIDYSSVSTNRVYYKDKLLKDCGNIQDYPDNDHLCIDSCEINDICDYYDKIYKKCKENQIGKH